MKSLIILREKEQTVSSTKKNFNIYLFRHGQTDWNKAKRIQGHIDTDLNDTGREEAKGLAEKMKSVSLNRLYSSDLKRAAQTAEIVNQEHGLDLIHNSLLREAFMGDAQGKTRDEIVELYGAQMWDQYRCLDWTNLDASLPGGETRREQINRFLKFFEEHIFPEVEDNWNIGLASHGGVLRNIIHHKFPNLEEAVEIHNCCCYEIEVRDNIFRSFSLFH
jgi:probable phosphoglycerate mutase